MIPKALRKWLRYKSAEKRVAKMSSGELIDYVDTLLSDVGMQVSQYRKAHSRFNAVGIREASFALAVVSNELASRKFSQDV